MTDSTRETSLHPPPPPSKTYGSQSEVGFYRPPADEAPVNDQVLRSLSPDDVQKMKYKIDLGTGSSPLSFSFAVLVRIYDYGCSRQTSG